MLKEYRVHGCIQRYDESECEIIVAPVEYYPDEKTEPEFFGVFEVQNDGTEKRIASFLERDDAEMFAIEKAKEEVE